MSKLMNEAQIARMAAWKLTGQTSCARCKFLYLQDIGYSNWTVEDTLVKCALDRNPRLPQELPYDWKYGEGFDNWPVTRDSRCERYEAADDYIHLDIDGNNYPDEFGLDAEATAVVEEHSGRRRE
jgi:hypothetical protein